MAFRRDLPVATPLRLWILHVAFIIAVLTYGVLTLFLNPPAAPPRALNTDLVFAIVLVVSILQIGAAYRLIALVGGEMPATAARGPAGAGAADPDVSALMDRRQLAMLLADSIIEVAAIYGLVGWILGWFEDWQFLVILAAALLALGGLVPRIARWISEFETTRRRQAIAVGSAGRG